MAMNLSEEERRRRSLRAAERNYRHGYAVRVERPASEYNVWSKMKARCLRASDKDWHKYGGRGITVCSEWVHDFPRFYADMGPRPTSHHSIERIDNDGPYSPGNCRWATAKEQAENRRNNVFIEHDGLRLTTMEWSRRTGIGLSTIGYRLAAGWDTSDVLTRPTRKQKAANAPLS